MVFNHLFVSLRLVSHSLRFACGLTAMLGLVALLPNPAQGAEPLLLGDRASGARYEIVLGGTPSTRAEQEALLELRTHLNEALGLDRSGRRFAEAFVVEGRERGPRTIYLGQTDFARAHGIDFEQLGPEEWVIKTVGEDIIIAGGRTRGTLYGVYEFLERFVGVVWATPSFTYVPELERITVPADLDLRGAPQIRYRGLSMAYRRHFLPKPDQIERWVRWRVRNQENKPADADLTRMQPPLSKRYEPWMAHRLAHFTPETVPLNDILFDYELWAGDRWGGFARSTGFMHNAFQLLPPERHQGANPEFYAMRNGKWMDNLRTNVAHRGELNYSNRESRPILAANLLDTIEQEREISEVLGRPPENVFFLKQMDNMDVSQDPETRRLVRDQYGAHSGVLLEYVNEVAGIVAESYPDVWIKTFAYMWSMQAPRNIRAADNVLVQWCNWYHGPDGHPDLSQSLVHPLNKLRRENLQQWGKLSRQIGIWDYYYFPNQFPFSAVDRLRGDFPLFDEANVQYFFAQVDQNEETLVQEGPWRHGHFFWELDTWLTLQLMQDPTADVDALVGRFLKAYYGAAAEEVQDALNFLLEAQRAPRERINVSSLRPATLPHFTADFYAGLDARLALAEAAVLEDETRLWHVRTLRHKLDMSLLAFWDELAAKLEPGAPMPFDRAEVLERTLDYGLPLLDHITEVGLHPDLAEQSRERLLARHRYYSDIPWPEALQGVPESQRFAIPSWRFIPVSNWFLRDARVFTLDPQSATGGAEVYRGAAMKEPVLKMGFVGTNIEKRINPAEIDFNAYQNLFLGSVSLEESRQIWIQDRKFNVDLDHTGDRPGGALENIYDVWVSLKVTGTADAPQEIFVNQVFLRHVPSSEVSGEVRSRIGALAAAEERLQAAQSGERLGLLPLTWQFYRDPEGRLTAGDFTAGRLPEGGHSIRVTEPWTAQDAGSGYHGVAWYVVDYKVRPAETDGDFLLFFPAVDGSCSVWVNGEEAGSKPAFVAWNEPFAIDLGRSVRPGERNRFVIRVEKDRFAAGLTGRPVLSVAP